MVPVGRIAVRGETGLKRRLRRRLCCGFRSRLGDRLRDRFRDNKDFKIVTIRGVGFKVVRL